MLYLIIFLNFFRFIGLEISPPGFYADEAAGATQVLCIAEDGRDFYGNFLPLFPAGFVGAGVYTPTYIYGQVGWTSIFGNSVFVFRSFLALITSLTVFFLYLLVRNTIDKKTALFVAFSASIMPWAFHFSRIAWDPPIAVLFLVVGLWALDLKKAYWGGILLGLSAISYPPMRLTVPLLLLLLPGFNLKKKLLILAIGAITCLPVLLSYLDANFSARTGALSIFSSLINNKYRNFKDIELFYVFITQYFSHFSVNFLFLSGDGNARSSIGSFGMLSWLDGFAIIMLLPSLILASLFGNSNPDLSNNKCKLLIIALLGIGCSALPSALTNEGVPHALRSIAAWPFYAILTGISLSYLSNHINKKLIMFFITLIGCIFFACYIQSYFTDYPKLAKTYFLSSGAPIDVAYKDIVKNGSKCEDLRVKGRNSGEGMDFSKTIEFSNKTTNPYRYLLKNWHDPEEFGIWSNGKPATLEIPMPLKESGYLIIKYRVFVNNNHPVQKITFDINNQLRKSVEVNDQMDRIIKIELQSLRPTIGPLLVKMETPDAISPALAGANPLDLRVLGVALISIQLE